MSFKGYMTAAEAEGWVQLGQKRKLGDGRLWIALMAEGRGRMGL